jgi:hypothetical protein
MIQDILRNKYSKYLKALDIYENSTSLILSKIVLNDEAKNSGTGTKILSDLTQYADANKQVIALTPAGDYGGDKNRLIQFYKRFGFKTNDGQYKHDGFNEDMIRYPKQHESKLLIKTLLRETLMSQTDKDTLSLTNFINFTKKYLGIDDDIKVELAFERTPDLTTYAYYKLGELVKVYARNRNTGDIMRSLAHELVHHKQFIEGRLDNPAEQGKDGTDIENEANAMAGEIVRKWGKENPEIYL